MTKNKLDKAIKEEQEKIRKKFEIEVFTDIGFVSSGEIVTTKKLLKVLEKSYKRIAKVALEASKLNEKMFYASSRLVDDDLTTFDGIKSDMIKDMEDQRLGKAGLNGYNQAVKDQHKIIKELTDEK